MYQKIMVPVDDSAASMRALHEAIDLAKLCQATLRAVHVVDLAQFSWGGTGYLQSEEVRKAIESAGEKVLARTTDLLNHENIRHETAILESAGDKIANLIVDDAHANQVDLLVMGTHGFSGIMHALMGSVAEGVLRQADMPVMLLRVRKDG
ncbi:universal stress protein [Snodgrassella sp. CFCC 13594]|uniref:universal stress protein n=1 Tax=Snodgrassella sp. CFCC 13594 TaxID=1775559 RepID=UPI0008377492|nr:universal stress protein [Snodgrassella sp. CFCC 13594]